MDIINNPKYNLLNKNFMSFNQVRLAAVSNYKLAQLTFGSPDHCSLRKTALIKNLVDIIYDRAPSEWFTQMTRWEYFTPESLEDMTQKDIEKIIYRYSQIIYTSSINAEKYTKDQKFLFVDYESKQQEQEQKAEDEVYSYYTALFCHPNSVFSNKSLFSIEEDCFKQPWQANEEDRSVNNGRGEDNNYVGNDPYMPSLYFSQHNNNNGSSSRLSWISDTGGVPTNSAIAQNLATKLMTLFDMEFNVDLSLLDSKRNENINGSTATLNRVFSTDDDEEEDDYYFSASFIDHNSRLQNKISPPTPQQSNSQSSSVFPPLTPPPHDNSRHRNQLYNSSLLDTPSHDNKKQPYQYYYSSSSDKDKSTDSDSDSSLIAYHQSRKITLPPNRTTSLEYRRSLLARFKLLADESSETSSTSFFNDSLSSVELEMNYTANNNNRHSRTPTFKGFLRALSSIKSHSSSRRNSVASNYDMQIAKKNSNSSQSIVFSTTADFSNDDNFGMKSSSNNKRKKSIQKIINFVAGGGKRSSTASSLSRTATLELSSSPSDIISIATPNSPSTTIMSRSSAAPSTYHQHPIRTGSTKRRGIYTTSTISDASSSFNWAEESHKRRSNTVDETMFTDFSEDTQGINYNSNKTLADVPQQHHDMLGKQRPNKSSSAMNFLKRLAFFKKRYVKK